MANNIFPVSIEKFAAYLDGNLSADEMQKISSCINSNEHLGNIVEISDTIDEDIVSIIGTELPEVDIPLPFETMSYDELADKADELQADMTTYSSEIIQHFSDTCAIKSQQIILKDFGINISEEDLRDEAIYHGWYAPGQGTYMHNVGNLLALHGVDCHQIQNGNVYILLNELYQGHKVIVGVDSGELWKNGFWGQLREAIEDKLPFVGGADHVLIVSGINAKDPANIKVIITDPGTGELCKEYPIDQFVNAAQDSNFFMVTTEEPTPHVFDSLENPNVEHFPYVGHMTFDEFQSHFVNQEGVTSETFLSAWNNDGYFESDESFEDESQTTITESSETYDENCSETTYSESTEQDIIDSTELDEDED